MDGRERLKTCVIEVGFDTDPNSVAYNEQALYDIEQIIDQTLASTTMIVKGRALCPRGYTDDGQARPQED